MTTVLNFGNSSSSNPVPSLEGASSLFSNLKLPTTFIIQPPSSTQPKTQPLLAKRQKSSQLGDLLMKKIKTQTANSENTSNQQSPTLKENSDDNCLESTSMLGEIDSPSIKSFCEEHEAQDAHRMLEGVLIPQRSISTPLVINTFNLRHHKTGTIDSHKQVQYALETLQKKMLMEQQAAALREILFKVQLAQEPLVIPPLVSASNSTQSSANSGKQEKNASKDFEEESEIIYGPVEYPLLDMAPPLFGNDFSQKESFLNLPNSSVTLSNVKGSNKNLKVSKLESALLDSLSATRADTQMSDSDATSSQMSEKSSQAPEVRRRKSKKTEAGEKVKKGLKKNNEQGNEKTKAKKQKNESLLSPVKSGRRLTERKKNKWQTENTTGEELKKAEKKSKATERRSVQQDENQTQDFFEVLRNLLNVNVNQEKASQLLNDNSNDVKQALATVEANKSKYTEELAL